MHFKNGWGYVEMLEVFKFLVLCLICILSSSFSYTIFYSSALFIVLIALFYDFDFETTLERHAINKVQHAYLKVRKFYPIIYPDNKESSRFLNTPTMNNRNKQTLEFDLSRFNKSGNVYSPISNQGNNVTAISRRFTQPRQTSTPLTKTSPWQKNSITPVKSTSFLNSTVHRSPRYSLSSASSTNYTSKNTHYESPCMSTIQTVAGPLLASTRFNVSLGTYTDSKSPGLAGRVVQYHNELQGNQMSTHQPKYGSPGQFPIVQLYKKELPFLTRIPRRCTVRIAPPDPMSYNSPEANTILRDSFIHRTIDTNASGDTEINTKSVLDALKEISRKRIHANDDSEDISKRQRKGSHCSPSTSLDNTNKDGKRLREDSPPKPLGTSVSHGNSISKKVCVTNEIDSSLSSSILMKGTGQKRKAAVSSAANIYKQRKISNGELISKQTQTNMETSKIPVANSTQTTAIESNSEDMTPKEKQSTSAQTEEPESSKLQTVLQNSRRRRKVYNEKTIEEIDEEKSTFTFVEPKQFIPVFSQEPLDIMRKNKLSVMFAALNGDEAAVIPLPDVTLSGINIIPEPTETEKIIHSILSPKNKTKHDKHVTFAIPSSESNTSDVMKTYDSESTQILNTQSTSEILKVNFTSPATTAVLTSPQISTPTQEVMKLPSPFVLPTPSNSSQQVSLPIATTPHNDSLPFVLTTTSSVSTFNSPASIPSNGFAFGASNTVKSPFSSANPMETPKIIPPSFGAITSTTLSNNTICTPVANESIKSVDKNSFGSPSQTNLTFGSNFDSSTVIKSPAFGGLAPSTANAAPKNPITTIASPSSSTLLGTAAANINFGFSSAGNNNVSTPVTTNAGIAFGSTSATCLPPPAFPTTSITFGNASSQPSISFGTGKPAIAFGSSNPTTTTANTSINFGTTGGQPAQANATFGAPTKAPSTAINNSNMFNFAAKTEANKPAASSTFAFGAPKPNQSPPKTGGFKFDLSKSAATPSIATTVVDTQHKTPVFGDSSISKPAAFTFGPNNNNATTTVSMFGTPTTTNGVFGSTTSAPLFDSPKTTESSSGFGTFGTPSSAQSPPFGTFNTPTTTQSQAGFGAYGANQNTKTTNTFAAPTTTSTFNFGATTAAKPFTFNSPTPTTNASNVFGNSSSTFGNNVSTAGVFGDPPTTAASAPSGSNLFGATTTTATVTSGVFGSTSTTTAAGTFGQQAGGMFGAASSGFGAATAPTTGSVFGTSNNNFGSSATPNTFGAPPNQTVPFGSGTANQGGVFGGNGTNHTNTFAASSASQNTTFGTPTNATFGGGFGVTNPPPTASAGGFGANGIQQASAGAFGANVTQPAATGGFGATNTQPAAGGFGSFGAAPTQTPAQQSGIFAFGNTAQTAAPIAPANAFQFGGVTQTPKPAGFNFSAGTSAPNMNFSAGTAPPPFGSASASAFGTPNQGQYNAPAPSTGMFSIGSGSTAPKQRLMIKARRRNN